MEYTEALLRLEAYQLANVYKRSNIALQAFIDRQVNATDDKGKFVVDKIEEVYDAQAEIDVITGKQARKANELQDRLNRYERAKQIAQEELKRRKGGK